MRDDVPYDVRRDFAPITVMVSAPNIMVVNPSVPANLVKEFIALAKSKPGVLNYGSAALGTANHLAVELFKSMTGTDIVPIPHKGAGPAVISLLANQVQMMIVPAGGMAPHIKAGRLRALGVTSVRRSPQYPDLPVISDSVPGYEYMTIWGIFAPAKTPKPILDRLNREIVIALNSPEVKSKVTDVGIDVVASTPQQLAAAVQRDIVRLGKVIKDANIREQ
jgi:tripartite-type tricarboxylate transporter receptor subunit TctC